MLDFVHALTHRVTATVLPKSVSDRWQEYVGWLTLCWQGRVREMLRSTLTYLKNNESRTDYVQYRNFGLPVSLIAVESLIKEVNYRIKGTEKFWDNPEGAEAILQVLATMLSLPRDPPRSATRRPQASGHRFCTLAVCLIASTPQDANMGSTTTSASR